MKNTVQYTLDLYNARAGAVGADVRTAGDTMPTKNSPSFRILFWNT